MRLPLIVALLVVSTACGWSADAPAPVTAGDAPSPAATPPRDAKPPAATPAEPATKPAVAFTYQEGAVTVGDNLATIDIPKDYHYLQSKDARFVVEKLWGNPPSEDTLGLIVPPKQKDVFEWAIIVQFDQTGYVKDDDAKSNDYSKILKDMQENVTNSNPARKKAGYPAIDLLGWAEAPQYDGVTHKMFWAKRMKFEGSPDVTLNYDVRILGRKGVLILRAVADAEQLTMVAADCKDVLAKTAFTSGNRYEDYSASSGDKVAEYGIAGLITGAVLLKTGIFKLLLKPLIVGGLIVVAFVRKVMNRNKTPPNPAAS